MLTAGRRPKNARNEVVYTDLCMCMPNHVCRGSRCKFGRGKHGRLTAGRPVAVSGFVQSECPDCACQPGVARRPKHRPDARRKPEALGAAVWDGDPPQ